MSGAVSRATSCTVACAEIWRHAGEVMASPFGTIPALGARLARATFSPDLVLTDGEAALLAGTPPLGAPPGGSALEAAMPYRRVFDVVWSGRRHIMMMASQVDRFGNQNISAIGDPGHPAVALIGCRGGPGNSVNHPTSYWVPDHSPRTFTPSVDVVCGVGHDRAAAAGAGALRFHDVRRVVSNLGVFDFGGEGHTMRLVSLHPGVDVDDVVAATGFELELPDEAEVTRLPTDDETALLGALDPTGAREREVQG